MPDAASWCSRPSCQVGFRCGGDLEDKKLEFAQTLGATHIINPGGGVDVLGKVRELTGGDADHAFECIGCASTIQQCLEAIRTGGMPGRASTSRP